MKLWWIIQKDLLAEWRARQVWPAMLLLGAVVGLIFSMQISGIPEAKQRIVGSLYWLTVCCGAIVALDCSFASEREEGCWQGLFLYPVSPPTVYVAKLISNTISLGVLQWVLVPFFVVLGGISWLAPTWQMLLLGLLGNLALTSVGTLVAALAAGIRQSRNLLALLVLPLAVPVVLAASEATRLALENDIGAHWWRWVQLLAAFAIVFIAAGMVLFEYIVEE